MANAIVFDYEVTPGGWFDPDTIVFDREIADQTASANVALQVDPGHLVFSARQIGMGRTLAVASGRLLLTGAPWSANFDIDFTLGHLVLTGRTIGMVVTGAGNVNLDVTRGSLILTGHRLPATLQLAVTPGHLVLAGRQLPAAVAFNVARTTLALTGRNVTVVAEADVALDVTRGHLALQGRDIASAIGLAVAPSSLTLAGRQLGLAIDFAVTPGSLLLTGRQVSVVAAQDVDLPVTRGSLVLTGRQLAFAISEPVQPGRLTFASRDVGMLVTTSVTISRGTLVLTGRDVGVTVGANLDLAVQRGSLRLSARDVVLAGNINVDRRTLVLSGHEIGLSLVGSFTIDVSPAHLVLGGRELDLQITVPVSPVPPVDATMIGGRRRGQLYPNLRFNPAKRKREEGPPELVPTSIEGLTPPPEPMESGTGLVRPGVGLKGRPARTPTVVGIPTTPSAQIPRGISRPAPGHVDITLEVERGHFVLPSPEEIFREEHAPPPERNLAADVDAIAAEMRGLATQRDADERGRKRAERNQRAIDLAIKTLLGE